MIFKSLTLENFGIYKGYHSLDLSITENKPIILLGALNGSGKTTFLESIQLCLYGKHAKCSNRTGITYSQFLANCKNHFSNPEDIVKLTLTFSHHINSTIRNYRIERSWIVKNGEAKDKVIVYCNEIYDQYLSEYWDDFVNEFIPLSLSDLFFFDGEKIENLAHPNRSADLIKTGLESLLGLDLLTQLQIDLQILEKKRRAQNINTDTLEKISECELFIKDEILKENNLKIEISSLEEKLYHENLNLQQIEKNIRSSGAHLINKRDELKFALGIIKEKIQNNKAEQTKLYSSTIPLSLVKDLISQTKEQIKKEVETKDYKLSQSIIYDYELKLLEQLDCSKIDESNLKIIKNILSKLSQQRKKPTNITPFINRDITIFNGIEQKIENEEQALLHLKLELNNLEDNLSLIQKELDMIPNIESVQHFFKDLHIGERTIELLTKQIAQKKEELKQVNEKLVSLQMKQTNLLKEQNRETFEQKRDVQIIKHIEKIKETLSNFSEILLKENIDLIQNLIKEKFTKLIRKEDLINKVVISTESFGITLFNNDIFIDPYKLSAGERQLLAIAILWALAEASGKELPTIIDTPLGRLDGHHRSMLIENYFPQASRQVILLSTDEEIIDDYYNRLKPSVSREYTISYNETIQSSQFISGYF